MDPDKYARDYGKALRYSADDEEPFHQDLIYGDTNDATGHLAYFDWLQEHGRETLAELLRRGVQATEGKWNNGENGLHTGSGNLGETHRGTVDGPYHAGRLSLAAAKPRAGKVLISATPMHAYTHQADITGNPFHYRALLEPHEAHALADEIGGEDGERFRKQLKRQYISDPRPKPQHPAE